jgi:ABC-2 type transport system permease protein
MRSLRNILWLTGKELRAIRGDRVMLVLIVYVFTLAVWMVADAAKTEVDHLSVAVVDEDRSPLSRRLAQSIQPPLFAPPAEISPAEAEAGQRDGRYVLVLSIPPDFERDLHAGHSATLQLLVDATAVAQAGSGATFLREAVAQELQSALTPGAASTDLIEVVFRNDFNPNLTSKWFTAVMQLMNNVTILMLILSGASMIREREHGTIEHVLVMPVRPHEIVAAKILASGSVILTASLLSLVVVVQGLMAVPVAGSLLLYAAGAGLYVVAVASLGLLLASYTRTMGQFGLLVIPVMVLMILLSGGMTPLESMPEWLQVVMRTVSPAPHFVSFAQAVLYRGAGLALVWPEMARIAAMAAVAVSIVLWRFRKVLAG